MDFLFDVILGILRRAIRSLYFVVRYPNKTKRMEAIRENENKPPLIAHMLFWFLVFLLGALIIALFYKLFGYLFNKMVSW
ncbi:MAG: hypothetical protein H6551_08915 [Chitinophagales bacterium]|nr:hypothetical protein [Chitinophagaceae bacterium]MCB9065242.1 hypothetical protein [Chitinophagales bacterium]